MADQTELRMNLAAIKRVDPYAKDIVDSSAHVAFYTFNSNETEWEKTDVEGAFFIYSRNAEPYYSIFINNRLNTNSLVEPITIHIELQSQPPFLLYRNERSRIRGFWFYNKTECDRIGVLVEHIVKDCDRKQFDMARQNNVDIFTMLSKAQEDFNNAQGSSITQQQKLDKQFYNAPDVTSQSVMNFFAAAKPAAPKEVPFFKRMLSIPVHVDQIEKQQRSVTPQEQLNNSISVDNSFIRIDSPNTHDLGTSPLAMFLNDANLSLKSINTRTTSIPTEAIENETRQKQQHQLIKNADSYSTSNKPALMPPTMFKASTSYGSVFDVINNSSVQPKVLLAEPELSSVSSQQTHLQPKLLKPEPLTQSQLLQALTYLIKHDPEFVKKLHEAYLQSFTEMVSM